MSTRADSATVAANVSLFSISAFNSVLPMTSRSLPRSTCVTSFSMRSFDWFR